MKKLPKINTAKLLKAALPYIFIGLMATKLGQAYRMVPEGDVLDGGFGHGVPPPFRRRLTGKNGYEKGTSP